MLFATYNESTKIKIYVYFIMDEKKKIPAGYVRGKDGKLKKKKLVIVDKPTKKKPRKRLIIRNDVKNWKKANFDEFFDYLTDNSKFLDVITQDFESTLGNEVLDRYGDINEKKYSKAMDRYFKATQKTVNDIIKKNKNVLQDKTNNQIVKFILDELNIK